jgi:hypothetical protein
MPRGQPSQINRPRWFVFSSLNLIGVMPRSCLTFG